MGWKVKETHGPMDLQGVRQGWEEDRRIKGMSLSADGVMGGVGWGRGVGCALGLWGGAIEGPGLWSLLPNRGLTMVMWTDNELTVHFFIVDVLPEH